MKTTKEIDEYVSWCLENSVVPRLKGYLPFEVLMSQGRIAPHYTTIRMMYTGSIDMGYYVNQNGLLEQVGIENPPALEPKEVLSEEKHPDGWEPEGLRPPQKNFTSNNTG